MAVTNLKGATCKFGAVLTAPAHNFIKFEAEEEIIRRDSMHALNYPYVTKDIEAKLVKGSVGFERVSNLKAATLTLGGVAIGHNFTKFEVTDEPMWRESLHAANYPYKTYDLEGKKVSGSIECELVDGTAYPDINVDSVTVIATLTGFVLNGPLRLNNLKLSAGAELGSKATLSFNFESIDGTYTWTVTAGSYPSIHAVSVPMEVTGSGLWLAGNVRLLNQKVSVSSELGSKAEVTMDYETVDGAYEYAEADVA